MQHSSNSSASTNLCHSDTISHTHFATTPDSLFIQTSCISNTLLNITHPKRMYRSRLVISFNVISWNNRGSLYLPLSLHSAALPSHTVPAAFTHTTYLRHLHSPRQLPHIAHTTSSLTYCFLHTHLYALSVTARHMVILWKQPRRQIGFSMPPLILMCYCIHAV